MEPQRWKEIDGIFAAALERDSRERPAFLDEACGSDSQLRAEVESLIAHVVPETLIQGQALEEATRQLVKEQLQGRVGAFIGPYRIVKLLGAGGMGQVYLAHDPRLNRAVAIKLLARYDAADAERNARFRQEALAASALNHPNILTIHEISEFEGQNYIATEFIDGVTLRVRLDDGELPLALALEIAIQVASALAVAHDANIVHRDIKPENVMIRADSLIKVLDFGIAKYTRTHGRSEQDLVETKPGSVIGTAPYMSPEQGRGLLVDNRSDIWSLGVLLYEMISGRVPFLGQSATETISLILQKEPAPLARYASDVPAELERIVRKALTKDREERYQTAKDILIDLRNLKRQREVEAEIERTVSPEAQSPISPKTLQHLQNGRATISEAGAATAPTSKPVTSSVEYVVSGIRQHKLAAALALILLMIGAAALFIHNRTTQVAIDSIAVLPFQNKSPETDNDYLSDGLAESLGYRLSQLSNLKVSPTSTVFRYKGKEIDPLKIGQELGVSAVVSGRIIQRGDSLIISAELVDVRNNKLVWGERYDRRMSDLLATQREIAQEIVDKLKLKVSSSERALAKHYTESNEAYQLYLKGRFYWSKRTSEALKKATDYFNQAIQQDPGFALAFAGLADCYLVPGNPQPPIEKMPKAKVAALRALALDETLAEAHTSLARVLATYDWDWAGAEKEYKRAIELDPRYAIAHQWYSGYLALMGRDIEMMAERKRAQELDPVSLTTNFAQGLNLYFARNYDEAIEQFQKTLELDPNFPPVRVFLPAAYEQKRMFDESIAAFQKGLTTKGSSEWSLVMGGLGHVYAVSGRKTAARAVLDELKQGSLQVYVPADGVALIYAGLGEKDQAFAWLEAGYKERSFQMQFLNFEPRWDNLRSDPRFAELLRRIGLPQ
jgi:serine/threonine protein kinase/Tfp pilus assembly protein PilF